VEEGNAAARTNKQILTKQCDKYNYHRNHGNRVWQRNERGNESEQTSWRLWHSCWFLENEKACARRQRVRWDLNRENRIHPEWLDRIWCLLRSWLVRLAKAVILRWWSQDQQHHIMWKLVRKANSQALTQTQRIRNSGGGSQQSVFFNKPSRLFWYLRKLRTTGPQQ